MLILINLDDLLENLESLEKLLKDDNANEIMQKIKSKFSKYRQPIKFL